MLSHHLVLMHRLLVSSYRLSSSVCQNSDIWAILYHMLECCYVISHLLSSLQTVKCSVYHFKVQDMRFLSANAFQLFFHYTLFFFSPNITNIWGPHTERNRQKHSQVTYSLLFSLSYGEAGYTAASLCFVLFVATFHLSFPVSASFLPLPLFCPLIYANLL